MVTYPSTLACQNRWNYFDVFGKKKYDSEETQSPIFPWLMCIAANQTAKPTKQLIKLILAERSFWSLEQEKKPKNSCRVEEKPGKQIVHHYSNRPNHLVVLFSVFFVLTNVCRLKTRKINDKLLWTFHPLLSAGAVYCVCLLPTFSLPFIQSCCSDLPPEPSNTRAHLHVTIYTQKI